MRQRGDTLFVEGIKAKLHGSSRLVIAVEAIANIWSQSEKSTPGPVR
ncbi:hypothetical protein [Mycobacteroides abscessus]|nr:hypothetical protein [Mycobacteroides abscessus]MBN7458033.1 hypothetical protein [Mycobacteroides abscessus subsp. abscessus]